METITRPFSSQAEFQAWLAENYATQEELWMKLYKKDSDQPSITYKEALDVALCYGWIDSLKRPGGEDFWLQRFTPRKAKSVWSKVNQGHIARLTEAGHMQPAGLAEVEKAKQDGRWEAAYASSSTMEFPDDFLEALAKNPAAEEFFETLNKTNKYAIFYRLQSAKKAETRQRRLEQFIEMLANGEKLYP